MSSHTLTGVLLLYRLHRFRKEIGGVVLIGIIRLNLLYIDIDLMRRNVGMICISQFDSGSQAVQDISLRVATIGDRAATTALRNFVNDRQVTVLSLETCECRLFILMGMKNRVFAQVRLVFCIVQSGVFIWAQNGADIFNSMWFFSWTIQLGNKSERMTHTMLSNCSDSDVSYGESFYGHRIRFKWAYQDRIPQILFCVAMFVNELAGRRDVIWFGRFLSLFQRFYLINGGKCVIPIRHCFWMGPAGICSPSMHIYVPLLMSWIF